MSVTQQQQQIKINQRHNRHSRMENIDSVKSFVKIYLLAAILLGDSIAIANSKSVESSQNKEHLPFGDVENSIRKNRHTNDIHTGINRDEYDDGYVMEDMNLVQNDQPDDRFQRMPFTYGQLQQRESSAGLQQKTEGKKRGSPMAPPNLQFTKEILIKQGRLKGYVRVMHAQTGLKNVRQYLGIPYAATPIGNGRFMPPGAPPPWNGLKMAIELSPVCPQNLPSLNNSQHHITTGRYNQLKRLLRYLQNENEDCLFLNLYVPEWSGIGPRPIYPVIVFIHGESYEWNSGNAYDGSILSSYGQVIVVTLNYRLGILGFLKPGTTGHTASNFGLLDQIAALQWVKDNIGAFGGDMGSVTLMGHSTGAACVNLLMLSPVAQGLFHRAILMSGSAMSDWAISHHPLQATMQVLHNLDCPLRDDNEEMLTCLRKKRYQDILKSHVSSPEFTTTFGPVIDSSIVPNDPQKIMAAFEGAFNRYDLLFGLTEIESYHSLNAVGIMHGLLENERDAYLRFYMQNRFEIRPDIAMDMTVHEYSNLYTNPKKPLPEEHRDVVLEILSDARVAAPLVQTGIYHSRANPSSYMYLFSHISKAGDYVNLLQSIVGEDLPYVFGAPLASARPFSTSFSPVERLLSEAIMVYWTNFAKTGNPKAPGRDHFLNMDPSNWDQYDIDWPPFNPNNLNYLNIGIPPVVSKNYRQQYMSFWNQNLNDRLTGAQYSKSNSDPSQSSSERTSVSDNASAGMPFAKPMPHVNYYLDKSTENPIRQLQYLLHHLSPNRTDMYQTQSTVETTRVFDAASASPENTFMLGDNKIVVKADSTLNVLIAMVIIFLLINVIIIFVYIVRRNYYKKNLKRKLDVLSIDGTTDDDLKRSNKFNDGDESFILDIVRRKNEYVPVKRYHSPINGFLLSRHYSTSTVDTHTKVSDWITQEVNRQSPKLRSKSPSFSMGTSNIFFSKKLDKISVGVDATPGARSDSILRQHPIELMKSKSFELNTNDGIIYPESNNHSNTFNLCKDIRNDIINSNKIESDPSEHVLRIDHRQTRSDPVPMQYPPPKSKNPDEEITSFIEDVDVNVTSRDECDGATSHFTLSPEETLQIIQMRNYPKVLPKYPNTSSEYVSTSSFKRRSMPSYQHLLNQYSRMPPVPPPRTSSTLDRKLSMQRSDSSNSEPIPSTATMVKQATEPQSPTIDEEPEITYNALHVGPLLPGSKENLYSTVNRNKQPLQETNNSQIIEAEIETQVETSTDDDRLSTKPSTIVKSKDDGIATAMQQPKSIMKRAPLLREISTENKQQQDAPQVLPTTSKIPVLRLSSSGSSNNSSSTDSNSTSNVDGKSSRTNSSSSSNNSKSTHNTDVEKNDELKRSAASISSNDTSSSSAETVKQIF